MNKEIISTEFSLDTHVLTVSDLAIYPVFLKTEHGNFTFLKQHNQVV